MSARRSSRLAATSTSATANTSSASAAAAAAASAKATPARKRAKANGKAAKVVEIAATNNQIDVKTLEIPVTPAKDGKSRKRKLGDVNIAERGNEHGESRQVPYTPTAAANGLADEQLAARINSASARKPRAAKPGQTNAPLVTPHGSRVVAHPLEPEQKSPTKAPITTDNLLSTAINHLIKIDDTGKLEPLIKANPCPVWSAAGLAEEVNPFVTLSSGIMAQQVSGAAASSIKKKFIGLFAKDNTESDAQLSTEDFPKPAEVAATEISRLREAGLSQRKAEYIKGLAEKFNDGELTAQMLAECSDEEVMTKLIAVRGLGKWSVEMFATFGLKRLDFFSTGDLGVQRGMAVYVGKDVAKLKNKGSGNKWKYMSEKDMIDISAKFSPYRGLFMWYMWRIEDVDVSAIQDN